jgi:hypothetical protein
MDFLELILAVWWLVWVLGLGEIVIDFVADNASI